MAFSGQVGLKIKLSQRMHFLGAVPLLLSELPALIIPGHSCMCWWVLLAVSGAEVLAMLDTGVSFVN